MIITYDCQNIFIVQVIVEWKSMFHTLSLNIEGATDKGIVTYNAIDFKFAKKMFWCILNTLKRLKQ
jgi:hypothetical protein